MTTNNLQLLESITQDRQTQEQSSVQLSAQIASLTHQVQRHEIISHDYVKLADRIVTIEHEVLAMKQILISEQDKDE